jgi:hypothetical protein
MRLQYITILILALVFVLNISATAKIFDLGNYSIDTGSYNTPFQVKTDSNYLSWSWAKNESTQITITEYTGKEIKTQITNESSRAYVRSTYGMLLLLGTITKLKGYSSEWMSREEIKTIFANITEVDVKKPYPGILATYPGLNEKIYVTALDDYTYLMIISNESDEMVASILRELKVIPKEDAQLESLKFIQNRL